MVKHNNKYLIFQLDNEIYGLPILAVKEIVRIQEITHIPKLPNYLKGVINLRGKIISVLDLRLKLGLNEKVYNDRTCIIVVESVNYQESKRTGFIVDNVSEVIDIFPANIESVPESVYEIKRDFLRGLGKTKDKVIILLDSSRLLENTDIEKIVDLEKTRI